MQKKRKASKKAKVKKAKKLTLKQQVAAQEKLLVEFLARLQAVEQKAGIEGPRGATGATGPRGKNFWGN